MLVIIAVYIYYECSNEDTWGLNNIRIVILFMKEFTTIIFIFNVLHGILVTNILRRGPTN